MSATEVPDFISNWIKYNTFLKKQDEFLADLFKHHQGKKVTYEYERVLVGLLHRYALNFRSVFRCWADFHQNHRYKFSIYTLLRPLLADYLLMLYLLEEFKFLVPTDAKHNRNEWKIKDEDFMKRYQDISTSFFQRLDRYLRKKVKNGDLPINEMQDFLSHHRDLYPEYFQQGRKIEALRNRGLSPQEMAGQIVNGKQFVKDVYDYYFRLSQFEHFTIVTEELMNDPDNNSEIMYIVDVTNYLLEGLAINISTLLVTEDFRDRAIDLINGFRSTDWRLSNLKE
jgi:hypothetical protein